MNNEIDIILETTTKILSKHITHNLRQNINDNNTSLINLWKDIEEQGLTKIIVKEQFEGSSLPFNSILPVIQISTMMGVPLPFTETIICNYLFSELNISPPNGMITFSVETKNIKISNNKVSGDLLSIPYLNLTDQVIFITDIDKEKHLVFIKNKNGKMEATKNFLSEPRYNLTIQDCEIITIKKLNNNIDFNHLGAIIRSAQMVGAMEKIINLSIINQ